MLRLHTQLPNSVNVPPLYTPFITSLPSSTAIFRGVFVNKRHRRSIQHVPCNISAMVSKTSEVKFTTVKGVINVQPTISGALAGATVGFVGSVVDGVSDLLGRSFMLELVSANLDCEYSIFLYFCCLLTQLMSLN